MRRDDLLSYFQSVLIVIQGSSRLIKLKLAPQYGDSCTYRNKYNGRAFKKGY